MAFVDIKHLNKFYTKDVPVITDMNISFPSTGLNIVVGKSGCGKTTLLNAIGTMDKDYTGDIIVDGVDLHSLNNTGLSHYKNYTVGFIFQKDDLFEELTVEENLKIVLRMQSKKANIQEVLEKVGLSGFENRKIKYLSGGERQRVSIARVIIKDCKIILADEPTSALDSKNGHRIFKLLKEISKERLVIAVTHDTKKAFQYADRIIKLSDGNILEDQLITKPSGEGLSFTEKRSNPLALISIFKFQFSHGLFINIFIALLIAVAMCVCSISKDADYVKNEYTQYEENGYTDVNVKRVMLTQIANGIDEFEVAKVENEESPFQYIREVSNRESLLDMNDIENLKKYDFVNLSYAISSTDGLYIKSLSNAYYGYTLIKNPGSSGSDEYGWNCYTPTNIHYYLYDSSNSYDIIGSLPTEGELEMLVSDTFADQFMAKNDKEYSGNYQDIIGKEVEIMEAYYSTHDSSTNKEYVYYNSVYFTVTGIIKTNQLNYCSFDKTSNQFMYFNKLETQTELDYMNSFTFQPVVYCVAGVDINSSVTENRTTPFLAQTLTVDSIKCGDTSITNLVTTFRDSIDYRFYLYKTLYGKSYVDNVYIDRDNRLIAKDTCFTESDGYLNDNQIIIPSNIAKKLLSGYSDSNASSFINDEITLTFTINGEVTTKKFIIKGISKDTEDDDLIYVSDTFFTTIYTSLLPPISYNIRISLKDMDYKERVEVMEKLYNDGYIIYPVDYLPGGYSEFIYEKGTAIFDEGETGNISPYYLFSEFYNFDNVKKVNRLLDILSTITVFTVVMALIVALGCVYLNERKHRLHIFKMSIIGVTPIKIFLMQAVTYLLMSALSFVLSYVLIDFIASFVNNECALYFSGVNLRGINVEFVIERVRIVVTNNIYTYSLIGALITLAIGFTCSAIAIKQFKK